MDYSRYLVLYSGGADSTFFIEKEPTARHLLHYTGSNSAKTAVAVANANRLARYLTEVSLAGNERDGETNEIHALYDTHMALDAGIRAAAFGMKGVVLCFNRDDLGIDTDALERILHRAEPKFKILLPLRDVPAADIRRELQARSVHYVSCMVDKGCGYCAKCLRGY